MGNPSGCGDLVGGLIRPEEIRLRVGTEILIDLQARDLLLRVGDDGWESSSTSSGCLTGAGYQRLNLEAPPDPAGSWESHCWGTACAPAGRWRP